MLISGLEGRPPEADTPSLPGYVYDGWTDLASAQPALVTDLLSVFADTLPDLYAREPVEYDLFLLDAALLRQNDETAERCIQRILDAKDAEPGVLENLVDNLRLWERPEWATETAERALQIVISGTDAALEDLRFLQNVLREARLQKAREALLDGEKVDYRALMSDLEDLGYEPQPEHTERLKLSLEHGFASADGFRAAFDMAPDQALQVLGREFASHALDEWGIAFVTSDVWLVETIDFLEDRRRARLPGPDEEETPEGGRMLVLDAEEESDGDAAAYWRFSQDDLQEYLAQRHLLFGTHTMPRAFALTWSLPLFFEYMESRDYIAPETRDAAWEAVAATQQRLADFLPDGLWRFAFVHRWPRPKTAPESGWLSQKADFERTFR